MTRTAVPFSRAWLFASLMLLSSLSHTQAGLVISTGSINNRQLFGVTFPGGVSFYGRAEMVYAISLQRYQTGPYLVTEMVVDMAGVTSQFRVYATEPFDPNSLQQKLPDEVPSGFAQNKGVPSGVQKLADRGTEAASKTESGLVVKDYPLSTHAKTIEFRLGKAEDVRELYEAMLDLYTRRGRDAVVSRSETGSQTNEVFQEINRLGGTLFSFD